MAIVEVGRGGGDNGGAVPEAGGRREEAMMRTKAMIVVESVTDGGETFHGNDADGHRRRRSLVSSEDVAHA
jgi:hypothetical protein